MEAERQANRTGVSVRFKALGSEHYELAKAVHPDIKRSGARIPGLA